MVRIFVSTCIILLCIPIALNIEKYKKSINYSLAATQQIEKWKMENQNLARANLHNLNVQINAAYNCTASIKELHVFSDYTLRAYSTRLKCELNQLPFHATIEELTIFKQNANSFLIIGGPCVINYLGAKIHVAQGIAHTEDQCVLMKDCICHYKNFTIKCKNDVLLYPTRIISTDLTAANKTWQFTMQELSSDLKDIYLKNVQGTNANKDVMMMQNVKIGKTIVAYNMTVLSTDFKLTTRIAKIKNAQLIIFPETVIIEIPHITLIAKNGKNVDDKILLNDIIVKNKKNIEIGHAKNGHIDTKNGKCILENGKFELDDNI